MPRATQSSSVSIESDASAEPPATTNSATGPERMPSVSPATIDRLNLEAALRDFETANARVVDLTSRLTLANEELLRTRHELTMTRIAAAEVDTLRTRVAHVESERDVARAETEMYRLSRSYRIGYKLTRLVRKVMP
jgi:hypothetical protein